MTRHNSGRRAAIVLAAMILGVLAGSARSASAMAHYKIWYFDDNNDFYQEGDVSVGGAKMNPPAWACTLRFYGPAYYRWVDGTEQTISSEDLYQDVRVKLPRPGCPENDVVFTLLDGTVIPYQIGASYLEISTHGAINWLDASGSNHACGFACVAPVGFKYLKFNFSGNAILDGIAGAQGTMFQFRSQSRVPDVVAGLRRQLSQLGVEIQDQIAIRRRTALGDREAPVRALEDAALQNLAAAGRKLLDSESRAREWHFEDASAALVIGVEYILAVQAQLNTAQSTFPAAK